MQALAIQQRFFQEIKKSIPPHLSLVDEIAELLSISTDSAYRRIRGEKSIDFEELMQLASHFKYSVDQFLHIRNDSILFTDRSVSVNATFHFDLYLQALVQDLTYMNSFSGKKLYYLTKDLPIFYHFVYPELAAFKCFFWMKTIVHDPAFTRLFFALDDYRSSFVDVGKKINHLYSQIPSVEVWNAENIHSTIRQIEYYKETGVFANKQDIVIVYQTLLNAVYDIENQADEGSKIVFGRSAGRGAEYQLYINEFILGDNTILVELEESKVVYINHGVINYMMTRDEKFCAFTFDHFENILKRSTPISRTNEKERKKFFNRIREKIASRIEAVGA